MSQITFTYDYITRARYDRNTCALLESKGQHIDYKDRLTCIIFDIDIDNNQTAKMKVLPETTHVNLMIGGTHEGYAFYPIGVPELKHIKVFDNGEVEKVLIIENVEQGWIEITQFKGRAENYDPEEL